jgi:hypothetical protein
MNILSRLHERDNFEAVNCCCLVVELDGELLPVYLRHFRSVLDITFIKKEKYSHHRPSGLWGFW